MAYLRNLPGPQPTCWPFFLSCARRKRKTGPIPRRHAHLGLHRPSGISSKSFANFSRARDCTSSPRFFFWQLDPRSKPNSSELWSGTSRVRFAFCFPLFPTCFRSLQLETHAFTPLTSRYILSCNTASLSRPFVRTLSCECIGVRQIFFPPIMFFSFWAPFRARYVRACLFPRAAACLQVPPAASMCGLRKERVARNALFG